MFLFFNPSTIYPQLLIQPTIELREQYQNHQNTGFNSTKPADRTDVFSRWRPGVNLKNGNKLSAQIVYQFSNDWYWTDPSNHSINRSDLLFGNVKYDTGIGDVTAGRQLIVKGNGRFFGDPDFNMVGRSWDAVRFTSGKFDIFGGKLGVSLTPDRYSRVGGASYDSIFGESMLAFKHDLSSSKVDTDIFAFDQLYRKKFHKLRLDVEAVGEEGHVSTSKLQAWAFSGKATYGVAPKVNVYGELDSASGGTNHNGTIMTFDQFYPGNHPYYGYLNVIGWRNMNDLMFGANWAMSPRSTILTEFHNLSLRSATDALYSSSGPATTYASPTGADGRDVGRELDVIEKYNFNEHQSLEGGFSIFKPDHFITSQVKGSPADEYWFYVQYKIKF